MKAVDGPLKALAHLNLVDEKVVILLPVVMFFYVALKGVVLEQLLELSEIEVDADEVCF